METARKPGAKWSAAVVGACFAVTLGFGTVHAASVIPGNNPQGDQNVLLTNGAVGNPIVGDLPGNPQSINISGNVQLSTSASGQAFIEGGAGFTQFTVSPVSPDTSFQDVIVNINVPNAPGGPNAPARELEVTVDLVSGPPQSFPGFDLGNGQNFFTVVAGPGEQIREVTFETSGTDITDVRQVRISGFQACPTCPPARVPEPGTLAVLGGSLLGFVGLAARRLNRR